MESHGDLISPKLKRKGNTAVNTSGKLGCVLLIADKIKACPGCLAISTFKLPLPRHNTANALLIGPVIFITMVD